MLDLFFKFWYDPYYVQDLFANSFAKSVDFLCEFREFTYVNLHNFIMEDCLIIAKIIMKLKKCLYFHQIHHHFFVIILEFVRCFSYFLSLFLLSFYMITAVFRHKRNLSNQVKGNSVYLVYLDNCRIYITLFLIIFC